MRIQLRKSGRQCLLCLAILTACANNLLAYTATETDSTRISITLKQATLRNFIDEVTKLTDYTFIYSEAIQSNRSITLNVKKQPLTTILKLVLHPREIDFRISDKHIILTEKAKDEAVQHVTISGYITDADSHESLISANIYEPLKQQGGSSNAYGFYSLTLPQGEAMLQTSYVGYTTQQHILTLTKDTVLHVSLKQDNLLSGITVLSDKPEVGILATQTGSMDIPLMHIRNTPALFGEPDVLKSIQLIPGVQGGTEGTAGIYVRGGGPDQNLFLLDGVPLYNVEHLFGLFSVFTPEAVKKVTLYKSSFPARFGGRLSSVIDVRTNDGDKENFHGSFSVGLISSKINFEGPIIKGKTSFNVSARRSYLDLLMRPFLDDEEKFGYYFYDTNVKINHVFNDKSRLYLSSYHGKDAQYYNFESGSKETNDLNEDNSGLNWGSTVFAARWNYIFNSKLFSNTTVAYNNYNFDLQGESDHVYNGANASNREYYNSTFRSGIQDWSYNLDFEYTPHPNHQIKFGAGYLYHTFRPEVVTSHIKQEEGENKLDTLIQHSDNNLIYAHEASVYAEDNFEIGEKLSINAGVHLSLFAVDGTSYFSAQPRFSMRYALPKAFALKGSYSKMNQYTHLLSSSAITMPTDLWVPVTKNIKPMSSHQYSVGVYNTAIKGWEFSVEGYYKSLHNVLEYKDGVDFFGSSANWQDKVEMGKGQSYGVEFLAQRTVGKTTGWLGYTLAKTDRQFEKGGINNGIRFPYKYDRRHHASLTVNHVFNKRIDVSASWVFSSGNKATLPLEQIPVLRPGGEWTNPSLSPDEYTESRNNFTMPPSHRLNIGVNFHKKLKRGSQTWNVSIYNAYNAMNPNFVLWETDYNQNESRRVLKKYSILPCIPSFSYTFRF